ncbi:unnamed protein product, partial [Iphiclides podalirius]
MLVKNARRFALGARSRGRVNGRRQQQAGAPRGPTIDISPFSYRKREAAGAPSGDGDRRRIASAYPPRIHRCAGTRCFAHQNRRLPTRSRTLASAFNECPPMSNSRVGEAAECGTSQPARTSGSADVERRGDGRTWTSRVRRRAVTPIIPQSQTGGSICSESALSHAPRRK